MQPIIDFILELDKLKGVTRKTRPLASSRCCACTTSASYDRVVHRIRPQIEAGCPALWAYLHDRLVEAKDHGWFGA